MKSIPYIGGKAVCPDCGKDALSYDARMTQKLPLGFGDDGKGRFVVDLAISKGFRGECMECRCVVFAVQSTRRGSKYPTVINRKLREMAGAL
jgi:hypothetical protein